MSAAYRVDVRFGATWPEGQVVYVDANTHFSFPIEANVYGFWVMLPARFSHAGISEQELIDRIWQRRARRGSSVQFLRPDGTEVMPDCRREFERKLASARPAIRWLLAKSRGRYPKY